VLDLSILLSHFFLVGQMIVKLMNVQRQQRQRLTEANQRLAMIGARIPDGSIVKT
jgi:hypothetical protein